MHSRVAVLDTFSTFVQFTGDRFEMWVSDLRLIRSMKQEMARQARSHVDSSAHGQVMQVMPNPAAVSPDTTSVSAVAASTASNSQSTSLQLTALPATFSQASQAPLSEQVEGMWVLHWHQLWQQKAHPQAALHLCAYLQESCYWAADSVVKRFVSVHYTLADAFQSAITQSDRIVSGYQPDFGGSLKAYARTAFGNLIRNQLRQQKVANICSDWGLLRKLSQTQLNQALRAAGFTQVESDILVWQCFQSLCQRDPSRAMRTLTQPNAQQLSQMADRYNHLRRELTPIPPPASIQSFLASLNRSAQAVRAYLNPRVTSLNQPQRSADPGEGKALVDDLATDETPMVTLLAAEAYAEQQQKNQQIGAVLLQAIDQLDHPAQSLLILYYQQALTQKEIAHQLQIKQYQVSRKLSRVRQQLLLSVAQWSQDTLHISIDSAVLANVSEVIHEWLQRHYAMDTSLLPEASEYTE